MQGLGKQCYFPYRGGTVTVQAMGKLSSVPWQGDSVTMQSMSNITLGKRPMFSGRKVLSQ